MVKVRVKTGKSVVVLVVTQAEYQDILINLPDLVVEVL